MEDVEVVPHRQRKIWYNIRHIEMSGEMHMWRRRDARARYSAAYPTDAPAPQASGCLSEANPKGRKGPRDAEYAEGIGEL